MTYTRKPQYTEAQKRAIMAATVTLDGDPADIQGAKLDYCLVVARDNSNRVEFSWKTAERIIANRAGCFKS